MNSPSKGVAALLAFIPPFNILGFDKYYTGHSDIGVIQTILSLTIIGILFTGPWAFISVIALVASIFIGGMPFLYPSTDWAPTTVFDKVVGGTIVALSVIALVVQILKR